MSQVLIHPSSPKHRLERLKKDLMFTTLAIENVTITFFTNVLLSFQLHLLMNPVTSDLSHSTEPFHPSPPLHPISLQGLLQLEVVAAPSCVLKLHQMVTFGKVVIVEDIYIW